MGGKKKSNKKKKNLLSEIEKEVDQNRAGQTEPQVNNIESIKEAVQENDLEVKNNNLDELDNAQLVSFGSPMTKAVAFSAPVAESVESTVENKSGLEISEQSQVESGVNYFDMFANNEIAEAAVNEETPVEIEYNPIGPDVPGEEGNNNLLTEEAIGDIVHEGATTFGQEIEEGQNDSNYLSETAEVNVAETIELTEEIVANEIVVEEKKKKNRKWLFLLLLLLLIIAGGIAFYFLVLNDGSSGNNEKDKDEKPKSERVVLATFNINGADSIGAEELSCQLVNSECTVVAPFIIREGYAVLGWAIDPNEPLEIIAAGEPITLTDNITYYAITLYVEVDPAEMNTFTATFEKNGAAAIGSEKLSCKTVDSFCTVKTPTITRTGHEIMGWSTSKDGTNIVVVGEEITLTEDVTYYAITIKESGDGTEKNFTATFNSNGATSIGTTRLSCKTTGSFCTVTAPTITRANHAAIGWSTSRDGDNPIRVGNTITLTGNTTYYAITAPIEKVFIAAFNANGASSIGAQALSCRTTSDSCTITAPTITRANHTIIGWSTSTAGTDPIRVGNTITLRENTTFFAITEPTERTFTATFNANGASAIGSNSISCTTTGNSCTVTAPSITRADYRILGWSLNPAGTHVINVNGVITLTGNATYYAITTITYTATFERNGATTIGETSLSCTTSGTSCTVTAPSITRAGWYIHGWSLNSNEENLNNVISIGKAITLTGNRTYHAITEGQITLTATFNMNGAGGTTPQSRSCTTYQSQGSCTIALPTFTRTNFTAHGWARNANETSNVFNRDSTVTLTGNTTFYAITSRAFTVNFGINTHNRNQVTGISANSGTCTIRNAESSCNVQTPNISRSGSGTPFWTTQQANNNPNQAIANNASITFQASAGATYTNQYYAWAIN